MAKVHFNHRRHWLKSILKTAELEGILATFFERLEQYAEGYLHLDPEEVLEGEGVIERTRSLLENLDNPGLRIEEVWQPLEAFTGFYLEGRDEVSVFGYTY